MRPINDLFSSLLSVFLGTGIASLLCVRCTPIDDSNLDNLKLLKEIEGVDDVPESTHFNFQSNVTALRLLRQSPEFKMIFDVNEFMLCLHVTKNENIFAFFLKADEEQLSVVFTPCGTLSVTWRLFYRFLENGPVEFSIAPTDEGLYNYTGVEPSIFQEKGVPSGLYLIQVLSQEDSCVQILASTMEANQAVVNISNFKIKTRIKFEKGFDMVPPTAHLLLPNLNIDFDQFFLVFVISRKKFYHSQCSVTASHPDRRKYVEEYVPCSQLQNDTELQVCRADGTRSLIDLQLEPNAMYYISVFAWDMLNRLSVPYSKVNFKFKRLPERLKDAVPQRANMTANGGKFSFKYKVRNRAGVIPTLLFYVHPCASLGPITVEVMATVRPNAFPLPPKYPSDNRINVTLPSTCIGQVGAEKDASPTVSWFPILTKETLVYCLFMKSTRRNETVGHALNSTDVLYSMLRSRNHKCVPVANRHELQPYVVEVKNWKPRVKYMVQVIVKKPKQSQWFLSYEILKNVHSNC